MSSSHLSFDINTEIIIELNDEEKNIILQALEPETKTPSSERSSVKIKKLQNGLVIKCSASDLTALRAALNSYLRWIEGILKMFSYL